LRRAEVRHQFCEETTFMFRYFCFSSTILALFLFGHLVHGQERGVPGAADAKPDTPPPPGVDKIYWDLTKSQDRSTKSLAERYVNAVKVQEWNDLTGKFRTVARYVKHEPDLSMVTIEIVKGRGAERTTEQKTVPVEKLSKTCQSRVRQIDAMQKKLKELAAAEAKKDPNAADGIAAPGASPETPGAPMRDERGADPAAVAGPGAGQSASPPPPQPPVEAPPDPSASEPDPLGFAEIVDASPQPGPGEVPPATGSPGQPLSK
jgi:hypothetical protein